MKKLILTILFCLVATSVFATTATFQEGVDSYTGAAEANLDPSNTNWHRSGDDYCHVQPAAGGEVGIFFFDLTSIDSGATITSATLEIYLSEESCAGSEEVGVHRIEDPDSSGEFDHTGSVADTFNDYATYAYKDHGSSTDWSSGDSNSFADVDDNAAEDTDTVPDCNGAEKRTFTVTNMVAAWVADPDVNAGFFLRCTTACNVIYRSIFNATSSVRPKLTVNYTEAASGRSRRMF